MDELADVDLQPPAAAPAAGTELAQPELPAPIAAVQAGQMPAVPVPPMGPDEEPDELQSFVIANAPTLPQMGLGVYEAQDLTTVLFNPSLIDEASLTEADNNGVLGELFAQQEAAPESPIAPDDSAAQVADVRAAQRPEMPVQTAPAAPAMPAPKVPAGTQNALAQARVRTLGANAKRPGLAPSPLTKSISNRPV